MNKAITMNKRLGRRTGPLALLLCMLACGAGLPLAAQTNGPDLVQAAVQGLNDQEHVRTATTIVSGLPGVVMARFDIPTRNMMLHVSPESVVSEEMLNDLLRPHGISIKCYHRRAADAAPFRHVDADHCLEAAPAER
jgi:hypothetical protein